MNCKPGDLAVIVSSPLAPELVGRISRCVSICTESYLQVEPHWEMDPPICDRRGVAYGIADSTLRPIRDPGEHAKDETLLWKPVPKEGELTKDEAELLLEALREWAETAK